jgi:hypothetical protein
MCVRRILGIEDERYISSRLLIYLFVRQTYANGDAKH